MKWPTASPLSAFLAGISIPALDCSISLLQTYKLIAFDLSMEEMAPLLALYFFVTMFVFVIGIQNLFPPELKTKVPLLYFPITREGWQFFFRIWKRMLIWFIGAAAGMIIFGVVKELLI